MPIAERGCLAIAAVLTWSLCPASALAADEAAIETTVIRAQVEEARNWIQKYQPQRQSQIEIAYTEWNLGFSVSKSELFSGLWASVFLGELAKNGVDMAQQWDRFADMLEIDEERGYARKPQYYALWLWNNYMGDRLIPATTGDQAIYAYASRSDDASPCY